MNNRLNDKRAIITGASSGIGKSIAKAFGAAGCNLIITARREKALQKLKRTLSAEHNITVDYAAFDVQNRDACQGFVEQLDMPVDILVNNAGLAKGTDAVYEADFDDWDAMIDTNVKGLLNITRFVSAGMKQRNKGHIINIGSTAGHESYAGGAVYCATKAAVKSITEATKKDLHGTPIRVSMISPGLVNTEFSEVRFDGDDEKAEAVYDGFQPLMGEDIAEVVTFVANRPPHVNILDTIVLPVAQSSATMVAHNDEV